MRLICPISQIISSSSITWLCVHLPRYTATSAICLCLPKALTFLPYRVCSDFSGTSRHAYLYGKFEIALIAVGACKSFLSSLAYAPNLGLSIAVRTALCGSQRSAGLSQFSFTLIVWAALIIAWEDMSVCFPSRTPLTICIIANWFVYPAFGHLP
jgi:hypothetical protein